MATLLLQARSYTRCSQLGVEYQQMAHSTYLQRQHADIQWKISRVQFDGDVHSYVRDYSYVHFTLLCRAVKSFADTFTAPVDRVMLTRWLVETEIAAYMHRFTRLVFTRQNSFRCILRCLQSLEDGLAQMATEGINLVQLYTLATPSSGSALRAHVIDCVDAYYGDALSQLVKSLAADDMDQLVAVPELTVDGRVSKVTLVGAAVSPSCLQLCKLVMQPLFVDLAPFIQTDDFESAQSLVLGARFDVEVVQLVVSLVEYYNRNVMDRMRDFSTS